MTDPARAIAQALRRTAARVREFEADNLPRENDGPLAAWRGGRRSAAVEIAEWIEERAREYEGRER